MPYKSLAPLPRGAERAAISKMIIRLLSHIRLTVHGQSASKPRRTLVMLAVLIGHQEGRPMSAHKISQYLELPRTTVQRSLDELEKLRVIEKHEKATYCMSGHPAWMTLPASTQAQLKGRSVQIIAEALEILTGAGCASCSKVTAHTSAVGMSETDKLPPCEAA